MTENQWTNVSGPSAQDPETSIGTTEAAAPAADGGSDSKKEAAKEEASHVAGQAVSAARGVAQTAKEEVANVASEAKSSAKDVLSQAKSGFSSQAGTQQQKAAEGIRTISSQLQTMADAPEQKGVASDLIRQAADRTSAVASWIEGKDPAALLGDVQSFARRKPGTFLLLAAGAGMLAGRLTRGLTAVTSATQGAGPSPQVAPVGQNTAFGAGSPAAFHDEPVIGGGAPVSTSSLPSGSAEDTPLRLEDDLYQSREGRHL
ncbi:hypothetical protein QMY03_09195 [Arthrobacter sp. KFRI-F3372]|nr:MULTISPECIES: hypothetical protein [Micrococcaceae]MEE2523890.1 hypothetical protein [Pseudarthrobacter sp. J47]MEE2530320.1 hypothetical protein [Pseudarthrobacter sp. J75]WHP61057.1 hypothetical protein QMY03_09195 [Arthrobacter sp. KFRI-F3372]